MKIQIKNPVYLIIIVSIFLVCLIQCKKDDNNVDPNTNDAGDYTLVSKFDSIRSYPDGGGNFVVYIHPNSTFKGNVSLAIEADTRLHASINKISLNAKDTVVELTIHPDTLIEIKNYPITLNSIHNKVEKKKYLNVQIYDWQGNYNEESNLKLNNFKDWLLAKDSKYSALFDSPKQIYMTYPEILIVEHWTYLFADYELRFCFHVMIPPNDWSRIQVRKRGSVEPELSAVRVTDGTISIIPNSDYPRLFGY
jgi:hypothetical protein